MRTRCALLAASLLVLASRPTAAHFALRSPASWRVEDALGYPQKMGPCGDEGVAAASGVVTPFASGETITITLDETIFHPGHYRVALAVRDRSELPDEPPVAPGATACGSVPVESPAVFPVLVDGALEHSEPFVDTRFIQVTLPSDVTCTHCTLQVLEFMSDHPAPCFYHHCADISIAAAGGACTGDGDCMDGDVCTTDRCNAATRTCEHVDTVTPTCDDGNPCTEDACSAASGCVSQPITLADVGAGFLGVLQCSGEPVPPAITALFGRAETSLLRAAHTRARAVRLLHRASRRLRRAARKVTVVHGRGMSTACATALGAVLEGAQARVGCLLAAASQP